jgi:threonine/homoserine efflux transporter RhtA
VVESRWDRKRKAMRWGIWTLVVVAGLIILVSIESCDGLGPLFGPLLGASMGASVSAYLTNMFTQRRRIEDDERRRVLATMLLSEIQFLPVAIAYSSNQRRHRCWHNSTI